MTRERERGRENWGKVTVAGLGMYCVSSQGCDECIVVTYERIILNKLMTSQFVIGSLKAESYGQKYL